MLCGRGVDPAGRELRDKDVGGVAVHIAARVMGTAGPDGSNTVLEDRGTQPLKGVEGAWQLFAVVGS